MSPDKIRARMNDLAGQIMTSIGKDEPFEKREPLWMEREGLREQLSRLEVAA